MSTLMKPPSWLGRVASKLLLDTWHEKFGRSRGTIYAELYALSLSLQTFKVWIWKFPRRQKKTQKDWLVTMRAGNDAGQGLQRGSPGQAFQHAGLSSWETAALGTAAAASTSSSSGTGTSPWLKATTCQPNSFHTSF